MSKGFNKTENQRDETRSCQPYRECRSSQNRVPAIELNKSLNRGIGLPRTRQWVEKGLYFIPPDTKPRFNAGSEPIWCLRTNELKPALNRGVPLRFNCPSWWEPGVRKATKLSGKKQQLGLTNGGSNLTSSTHKAGVISTKQRNPQDMNERERLHSSAGQSKYRVTRKKTGPTFCTLSPDRRGGFS